MQGFFGRAGIDVVKANRIDAANGLHRERLEFGLGAVADHRHCARALRCQMPRGHSRGRGRAERGQQRHFREQHRIAGRNLGEEAEGGHGLQPVDGIFRMAVHIFEAVDAAVGGRHQFDHAVARMAGDTRRLVEAFPASEIVLDGVRELRQNGLDAQVVNEAHHVLDTDERHHGLCGRER